MLLNPQFTLKQATNFAYLSCSALNELGIEHFFATASLTQDSAFASNLSQEFAYKQIFSLKQVHGNKLQGYPLDLSDTSSIEADGWLFERNRRDACCFLIRTADCTPVILLSQRHVALLHVGWRGLTLGIVEHCVSKMQEELQLVVTGPCAERCCYQVGREVLEKLNMLGTQDQELVCKSPKDAEKYMLSMSLAVRNRLQQHSLLARAQFISTQICTVCNPQYNSYRRDKHSTLRNISGLVI